MQDLMTAPDATQTTPRTFDQITPPKAPTIPSVGTGGTPTTAIQPPGTITRGISALMGIGFPGFDMNAPIIQPTNPYLNTARATGHALGLAGGAIGTAVANPVDTILQLLEAKAAQRRQALQTPQVAPVLGPDGSLPAPGY